MPLFSIHQWHMVKSSLSILPRHQQCQVLCAFLPQRIFPVITRLGALYLMKNCLRLHMYIFCGMPVALVVAASSKEAVAATKKIILKTEPLPVITDARTAKEKGELIIPPRTFKLGDIDSA